MYIRGAGGFGFDQGFRRRYAADVVQPFHGAKVLFQKLLDHLAHCHFMFYVADDSPRGVREEIRDLGVFHLGSRSDCHAGLEIKIGKCMPNISVKAVFMRLSRLSISFLAFVGKPALSYIYV